MIQCFLILELVFRILANISLASNPKVRTLKFLLEKSLFGKPMNLLEFRILTKHGAVFHATWCHLIDTVRAEQSLAFLAFFGIKNNFETNCAGEIGVLFLSGLRVWDRIFSVVHHSRRQFHDFLSQVLWIFDIFDTDHAKFSREFLKYILPAFHY